MNSPESGVSTEAAQFAVVGRRLAEQARSRSSIFLRRKREIRLVYVHAAWIRVMNALYADSELTFYLPVYRNHDLADTCLRRLRTHFPCVHVIIRSDGDDDPRYRALAARHG